MREDLQNKLYEKYAKIFRQKDLSPQQSCMSFGIEVGNGWYNLIDNLCSAIQNDIDNNKHRDEEEVKQQLEAAQVKSKFGGLRFYVDNSNDYADGAIALAESLSRYICIDCGRDTVPANKGKCYPCSSLEVD